MSVAVRSAGTAIDESVLAEVRRFAEQEVRPIAHDFEARGEYPVQLVARMREMGLFGAI
ncbi:MAG: acyl-CoA dehydrogenase family protein, partial [Candidatus Eremiobacteraeota bacterium]|nr:acyl-CoA dehydrogenase family protein [Candidatus Eremiobacteraeota bacterium]